MHNLRLLLPESILAAMALVVVLADLFVPRGRARALYHLAWLSAAGVLVWIAMAGPAALGTGTLWAVDPFSQFFKVLTLLTCVLCLLIALDYKELPEAHAGTFSALMLLSTAGLMYLVSGTNLLLIFVALELVSISSFILSGFERTNPKSNEGSMKYFLFGAFSSALMVYGISLYYGATGTLQLAQAVAP